MKILLIDADSTIPNIPIMKLYAYYKKKNCYIDFVRLDIPYYPNRKKEKININTSPYDKTYCSVVFDGSINYILGNNIDFGGTGYSLTKDLPLEIENIEPDYSIYPENNVSYGFITRGCIRKCKFCQVPTKEGRIRQVATIEDVVRHKRVKFLDNNILAFPGHYKILGELVKKKIRCCFNQGLDIRLIDKENSMLLSKMNYLGEYTFAFDHIELEDLISKKLDILNWRKNWQFRFFVYVHPDMLLSNFVYRVNWLIERKCLPYVMRDISCYDSPYKNFYTDIACWCNQPNLVKRMDFKTYIYKRHPKNKNRADRSMQLYIENS